MKSNLISNNEKYSLRVVFNEEREVTQEALDVINLAVDFTLSELGVKENHLYVTVVAGESLYTGGDYEWRSGTLFGFGLFKTMSGLNPNAYGFGLYHSGIQHAIIAGVMPDLKNIPDLTHDTWIEELAKTAIHETIHFWQDINGKMSEDCETEAEKLTEELYVKMQEFKKTTNELFEKIKSVVSSDTLAERIKNEKPEEWN